MKKHSTKTTHKALAALYKCSPRTISRWRKEGVDIFDPEAVARHMDGNKSAPPDSGRHDTLKDLRAEKLRAEIDRIKFAHEVEKGKFIPKEEADREGMRIGLCIRGLILQHAQEVPTWEGLDACSLDVKMKQWVDDAFHTLRDLCLEDGAADDRRSPTG